MNSRLFVGNLSFNTTEDAIREAFAEFGEVVEAKLVTDRDTGRSRDVKPMHCQLERASGHVTR